VVRDPARCRDAGAASATLPEVPEGERSKSMYHVDFQPSVEQALSLLSSPDAFTHCSDEDLAPLLAVSMTRFDDLAAISDTRGGDGVRIDVRHASTAILENLSGQPFGTLSIRTFWEPRCDQPRRYDPSVILKWETWWNEAQKNPVAVIAAARTGKVVPFVFESALARRFESPRQGVPLTRPLL